VKIAVIPKLSDMVVSISNKGDTINIQMINENTNPLRTFNNPSNKDADLLCINFNQSGCLLFILLA